MVIKRSQNMILENISWEKCLLILLVVLPSKNQFLAVYVVTMDF